MVEIGMGENKGAIPSYLAPWVGEAGVVGVRRLDVRLLLIGVPYGRDPPATGSHRCAGGIVRTGDGIQDGVDGLGSDGLGGDGLGVDDGLRILLHRRQGRGRGFFFGVFCALEKTMGHARLRE